MCNTRIFRLLGIYALHFNGGCVFYYFTASQNAFQTFQLLNCSAFFQDNVQDSNYKNLYDELATLI